MRPIFVPGLHWLVAVLFVAVATGSAVGKDPLETGEDVAKRHCARCHVIGEYNRMGGIGSTPSFKLLRKRADWEERYTSFYARLPHPSFVRVEGITPQTDLPPNAAPVDLSAEEVEALMTYIRAISTE